MARVDLIDTMTGCTINTTEERAQELLAVGSYRLAAKPEPAPELEPKPEPKKPVRKRTKKQGA